LDLPSDRPEEIAASVIVVGSVDGEEDAPAVTVKCIY